MWGVSRLKYMEFVAASWFARIKTINLTFGNLGIPLVVIQLEWPDLKRPRSISHKLV